MPVVIKIIYRIDTPADYLPGSLGIPGELGAFYLAEHGEMTGGFEDAQVFDSFSEAASQIEGIEMCAGSDWPLVRIEIEAIDE